MKDRVYIEFLPAPALRTIVKCFWYLNRPQNVETAGTIVPDNYCDLIFDFSDEPARHEVFLSGMMTRPVDSKRRKILGVRFMPGMLGAIIATNQAEFSDKAIDLAQILGRDAFLQLTHVFDYNFHIELLSLLQSSLIRLLDRNFLLDARITASIQILHAEELPTRIDDISAQVGLSRQHFRRIFSEQVGISPKQFANVSRVQKILKWVNHSGTMRQNWADLSYRFGYADQAHFVKEFSKLTGTTPTRFAASNVPNIQDAREIKVLYRRQRIGGAMKNIGMANLNVVKANLLKTGRGLDKALYSYFFDGGSRDQVIERLAPYQNLDGGFGHGLEPDIRSPLSSVIATTMALEILRQVNAPDKEPMIQKAIAYLISVYEPKSQTFPIIHRAINDAPHAFWWAFEGIEPRFGNFLINPTIAVIGFLVDYCPPVLKPTLNEFLQIAETRLSSLTEEDGFYSILAYGSLVQARKLPEHLCIKIRDAVATAVKLKLETDPTKWTGHCLTPLMVSPTADHPFRSLVTDRMLTDNLQADLRILVNNNGWPPPWSWEAADPAAWELAKHEWESYLTLQKIRSMHSYGSLLA
jgi:AraC-like DNA-binding protein